MNAYKSKVYFHMEIRILYLIIASLTFGSEVPCRKPSIRSPYIRHYDVMEYDHVHLREHHVTKRSTMLKFKFKAFERTFTPILRKDNGHIYPDFLLETSNRQSKPGPPLLYTGTILEDGSKMQGVLKKEGHFEGSIMSRNETFYIESASYHFNDVTDFHTIIYKHSDVIYNTSQSFCAHSKLLNSRNKLVPDDDGGNLYNKQYLRETYTNDNFVSQANEQSIRKRRSVDPRKKICELYIQVDHLFYMKYDGEVDTIIEKLSGHVQAANGIYNNIDFDASGKPDNLGFIIKKIKIWDDPTDSDYRYDGNYAVDYFLTIHSKDNYNGFCLSYLFSNRDFNNGVLGLAWIAVEASSVAGGVCETHKRFDGKGMSLNTGVLTFRNYGSDVPSAVSYPTFAHELGHSLGADHDPVECMPGDPGGNYVMYASSTSGHKENNYKLSSCSIKQIHPVVAEKARGDDGCFVEYTVSLCGNRIVEDGEECDCGWEEECLESCCNPQVNDTSLPGVETPCTLRSTSVCSPSEGIRCQADCQYSNTTVLCRHSSDCLRASYCSGSSVVCPASSHVGNGSVCGRDGQHMVCLDGKCTGDVCAAFGREQCYCKGSSVDDWKNELLCTLCCMDGGNCTSSEKLDDIPTGKSLPGTPCNKYKGYCDVFNVCRKVDPEGPFRSLKRLLFSSDSLEALIGFMEKHWYVGVIIGVVLIVIIVLVGKFCSKSTKDRIQLLNRSTSRSTSPKPIPDSSKPRLKFKKPKRNQIVPDTYI